MKQVYTRYSPDEDMHLEYEIMQGGRVTSLIRSKEGDWLDHAKGEIAITVKDNGNGYEIQFPGHKAIKLDYAQMHELFVLQLHSQDTELEFRESKTTMKWPLSQ